MVYNNVENALATPALTRANWRDPSALGAKDDSPPFLSGSPTCAGVARVGWLNGGWPCEGESSPPGTAQIHPPFAKPWRKDGAPGGSPALFTIKRSQAEDCRPAPTLLQRRRRIRHPPLAQR